MLRSNDHVWHVLWCIYYDAYVTMHPYVMMNILIFIHNQVIRFDSVAERQGFLDTFKEFLDGEPGMTSPRAISVKQMFVEAVSKEDRKEQLSNFFKAVFSQVNLIYTIWSHSYFLINKIFI